MLDLDFTEKFRSMIPRSGDCYLTTCKRGMRKVGNDDAGGTTSSRPAYVFNVNCLDVRSRYVCNDSDNYIVYLLDEKKQLAGVLKLEPIHQPPFSVFLSPDSSKW